MLPQAVRQLAQELAKLPGIGPKSAERLALHLLRQSRVSVSRLATRLVELHDSVHICTTCYNLAERETCSICQSQTRNQGLLCVVESALDVAAFEKTGAYNGRYHVLGGVLSPLEGIGADQLTIKELIERIEADPITEVIIALDHKMESDATTRHIMNLLQEHDVAITRLARGLPTGGDIEFADSRTLEEALAGRRAV